MKRGRGKEGHVFGDFLRQERERRWIRLQFGWKMDLEDSQYGWIEWKSGMGQAHLDSMQVKIKKFRMMK